MLKFFILTRWQTLDFGVARSIRTHSSVGKDSHLCRVQVTACFTLLSRTEGFKWQIAACLVLDQLCWDVLLVGFRAASCLQGYNLGLRRCYGMW